MDWDKKNQDNSCKSCLSFCIQLEGIDHAALSVRNVERAAQWYVDVLGFERKHEGM